MRAVNDIVIPDKMERDRYFAIEGGGAPQCLDFKVKDNKNLPIGGRALKLQRLGAKETIN